MSFRSLLNKKCSWTRRKVKSGSVNAFGETAVSDVLMASDVPCSRQVAPGIHSRNTVENSQATFMVSKLTKFFMSPTDIMEGDIVHFYSDVSGDRLVKNVRDTAGRGHHLEIYVEEFGPVGEGNKVRG